MHTIYPTSDNLFLLMLAITHKWLLLLILSVTNKNNYRWARKKSHKYPNAQILFSHICKLILIKVTKQCALNTTTMNMYQ